MRNLKRALSLGLTAAMISGLMVMGSGAVGYADVTSENNQEAIEVLQAVGIMTGVDEEGNFNPEGTVTRNQMAVIMANLMEYNVANYRDTSPFTDVPSWAEAYVAACYTNGITSGYSDTIYGGEDSVTTAQAALMLMKALGYFQYSSDFGQDWQLATLKQGNDIDLFVGVDSRAEDPLTRNDVAQLVLNTLKSGTVTASSDGSLTIGGVTITSNVTYSYVTSNQTYATAISSDRSTSNNSDAQRSIVELGEQLYMGDLKLNDNTTDVFGRPARYWEYDGNEVGTYPKTELLRQEYTAKVTGRDLYDLLGKSVIDDYSFDIYVDGETEKSVLGDDAYFTEDDLTRANDDAVGDTGNGVLTQVYQDIDEHEITIVVINTYLAKAQEDYDEKNEEVDLVIYELGNKGSTRTPIYVKTNDTKVDYTVEADEFDIEDVAEDDLFLVTVADGAVQSMEAPEILSDTTIANFRLQKYVTADGTQYDYADTVMYDEEVLDAYDDANMKDITYNVILDPYGYMIGIEQNEDPDQYVFLTGIDGQNSNLSVKSADANVIFLDGTMDTVTVKMDKSTINTTGKNLSQLNTWCTYTVDKNGNYTLKEVASALDKNNDVAQYAQDVNVHHDGSSTPYTKTINKKYTSLVSAYDSNVPTTSYVYGNDDSVYINVELKNVVVDDDSNGGDKRQIVDDVESITVGLKNANLVMENLVSNNGFRAPVAEIYTLFNDNGRVIAAVTIGEDDGATSNFAYITSSQPNREAYDSTADEYTWTREAVVNGEIVELREVGDSLDYLSRANMKQGEWYEIKYDADGNVRKVEAINFAIANDKYENQVANVEGVVQNNDTVLLADITTVNRLYFKNGTLYTSTADNRGFSVSPDVKVVLALANKTGTSEFDDVTDGYTGYNGLEKALRDLNANAAGFTAGSVEVSAILENGVATSIVINDTNAETTGTVVTPGPATDMGVTVYEDARTIVANFVDGTGTIQMRNAIYSAMRNAGIEPLYVDMSNYIAMADNGYYYSLTVNTYYSITVDNDVVDYALRSVNGATQTAKTTKAITVTGDGTHAKVTVDGASPSTSYETYAAASYTSGATVSGNTVIETGYVGRPGMSNATVGLPADVMSAGYVKVGSSIEVTYTAASASATDQTVTMSIANAGTATVSAAQVLKAGKTTLTFTLSNITAQTGDITFTAAAVPTPLAVTVTGLNVDDSATSGLKVEVVDAPQTAVATETIYVTVRISGVNSSAKTFTVSDSGSGTVVWDGASVPNNMSSTGATLTIQPGTWSHEVRIQLTVSGAPVLTVS